MNFLNNTNTQNESYVGLFIILPILIIIVAIAAWRIHKDKQEKQQKKATTLEKIKQQGIHIDNTQYIITSKSIKYDNDRRSFLFTDLQNQKLGYYDYETGELFIINIKDIIKCDIYSNGFSETKSTSRVKGSARPGIFTAIVANGKTATSTQSLDVISQYELIIETTNLSTPMLTIIIFSDAKYYVTDEDFNTMRIQTENAKLFINTAISKH